MDSIIQNWLIRERIRYLSCFTAIWSAFNDFYNRDSQFTGNDRNILNDIQALATTDPLVVAFEEVCVRDDQRVAQSMGLVQDAMTKGVVAFTSQTRFSNLVRAVFTNPVLNPFIWVAGTPRPSGRVTRPVPILHVADTDYFGWYRELRTVEASSQGIAFNSISVQTALESQGVLANGSTFYVGPMTPTSSAPNVTTWTQQLQGNSSFDILSGFANPASDWVPASRHALALELLYLVRNHVMHGSLNPTDVTNDEVGRAAVEMLYDWLWEYSN